MAFEKYTESAYGGRYSNINPQISIHKAGLISFNVVTLTKYVKDFQYVILYFDEDINRIGLEFTNEIQKGARKITRNSAKKRCSCSVKNFLFHHNVDYSVVRKYDLSWDEENSLYVIQL